MTAERDRTVAFIDLTGYTSLTDTHGDAVAVHVIDQLLAATQAAVTERGRIVKTLGATVNLAARLADLAPPGELRVADAAAGAATTAGTVEPVGPTAIRGFHDLVSVHRVLLCPPQECVTDPVCGMRITTRPDTPSATVGDGIVWFCTVTCADRFAADPGRYLVEARSHG